MRASLEGLTIDLRRQSEALDVDRPLLVVMLMGGTGVGKSTLLNALAGGNIAHASFHRPTTRDPVVYYHESIRPDRLDPALRHCRLVPHDRKNLEQKILVDTPDVDSNDLTNHTAYIQSWLQALEGDPKFIFRASAAASKAADSILNFSRPQEGPEAETEEVAVAA